MGWLLAWAGVCSAAGGYGPFTPPSLPGGPTAFESKIAGAKTFSRSGGRLTASIAHSDRVTVTVSPGTFTSSEQVVITGPSLSELNGVLHRLHRPGYTVATGFALLIVDANGKSFTHRLAKRLTVTITGPGVGIEGEKILSVTSPAAATVLDSRRSHREIGFSVAKEADLLAIDPASKPHGT